MVIQSMSTKISTCSSCSKPTRICLCNRLRTPILHNSIAVTILQHTLEKKHPLNSTRIATIGLKNVDVITVSDVNFQAHFSVKLLGSSADVPNEAKSENAHNLFDEMPCKEKSGIDKLERFDDKAINAFNFTTGKYGTINSFGALEKYQEMSFDDVFESNIAVRLLRQGFVVKKELVGSNAYEEIQEFEITVCPGSVLLFPSERSIDVASINFDVKNLIVLDGTWAKAKRMYSENPWLRFLPHIKLDLDKLSLYREVRHQPRDGYLSTIESIVYAMKGVGDEPQGLDSLLDVFESMVGDQRRCKDERLMKLSQN